ncbi:putative 4-coumarate--CoA ligase [Triangularia setosa]|uniref:4-coumarate--CoA ligase n=1 Tax=Triangularia setosa TaxID=2587417 RepID=A0AAN6W9S2_9PEZI|nr:putative 4-coumarate--CoA ligase [Podospora setosa]
MGSIVEKTSAGTIYKASISADHPELDLLTFLFESPHTLAEESSILHADAADPDNNRVTKSQLRTLVKSTASILRNNYNIGANGPSKDVVLAISTGHFLLPSLFYSTIAAGGVFSASNPGSTPKELAAQIKQVGVKLILCNADTKATAIAAAKLTGLPTQNVVVYSSLPGGKLLLTPVPSPTPLPPSGELSWTKITSRHALDNSIICLLFSSGTTGPPKACLLSHTNMVAEAALVLSPTRDFYARLGLPHVYRTVAHLPAAHIAGIQGYFVNPFYLGGAVYWMRAFDFPLFLTYTAKYKVTHFFSVPPVFLLIAKSPLVTDQFATVEQAVSGAAPMGKELQRAAKAKLGGGRLKKARLVQTWGLSETTGSVTALPMGSEFEDDESGSVSALVSGIEARIVGEDGKDVEVGKEGEIWVRGPMITKGYWNNEQANQEGFADGAVGRERWFKTGDVAVYKGGLFYVVDRKKELIKYKGNQVAPAELEALLISHPKILDAAVIGVDDEKEGTEVPKAYVVVADQKGTTGLEIQEWVAKQVSNHKKLRGGVVFLAAIPKSPSGKILRKDLRALAKKQQQRVSKL